VPVRKAVFTYAPTFFAYLFLKAPEYLAQGVALEGRVIQRSVHIHVEKLPSIQCTSPYDPGPPERGDGSCDGTLGTTQRFSDLLDRGIGTEREIKNYFPMAGKKAPIEVAFLKLPNAAHRPPPYAADRGSSICHAAKNASLGMTPE
jgi:hypothetical protein